MTPLEAILPLRIWIMIAAAVLLLVMSAALLWIRRREPAAGTIRALPHRAPASSGTGSIQDVFNGSLAPHTQVFTCSAELMERRPLSEAQWDSDVPAAWTIFRLSPTDAPEAAFHLGLLLPIREPRAFSSGYLERVEGSTAEPILVGFSRALGGPVPSGAITGSDAGFLEFKTYVDNEKPDVVPGNLEMQAADYWIMAKGFVQDVLEFYLRLNPAQGRAEFATSSPVHGEEIMRVLAATLRPTA